MRERSWQEYVRKKSDSRQNDVSTTYFGFITYRHRFTNEKKVITARVYSQSGVSRLIGHLPFFLFRCAFSFPSFFSASYNTHKRTGMTKIGDILEKKKEGKKRFFAPFSLSIYNLQKYISSFFCSYTKNVVIFFVAIGQLYFFWTQTPFSLFSLSLVVAIIIMYACLCWPEKSPY